MKRFWARVFVATMQCAVALAQGGTAPPTATAPLNGTPIPATQSAPSNPAPTSALRIAPGSVIPVELTKSIDAKKVKIGDEVEAKVTQDLKAANGEVIVPKDTKVIGRVTEVEARNKEQKESQVGIAFDHAITKAGGSVPLAMSIQAIIAPPSSNPNNGNAGSEGVGQSPPGSGAGMTGNNGARSAGMGVGAAPPPSPGSSAPGDEASTAQSSANAHQPINGNTQGVVGLSHLKLSVAANATQGSVISSEKGNVKLDSGTFMLLRVNQ
jgi:hypothetical protein